MRYKNCFLVLLLDEWRRKNPNIFLGKYDSNTSHFKIIISMCTLSVESTSVASLAKFHKLLSQIFLSFFPHQHFIQDNVKSRLIDALNRMQSMFAIYVQLFIDASCQYFLSQLLLFGYLIARITVVIYFIWGGVGKKLHGVRRAEQHVCLFQTETENSQKIWKVTIHCMTDVRVNSSWNCDMI